MPARKISTQSFEDILSELGDDPAIPDPHGIRKPNSPNRPDWDGLGTPQKKPQISLNLWDQIPQLESLKKIGLMIGTGGLLITSAVALFFTFNPSDPMRDPYSQESKGEIAGLKRDLALLRKEMLDSEDAINETIDLIEVSIHLLEKNRPKNPSKSKPASIPFESDLRLWRYLGVTRAGDSYKAFFHNGKTTLMVEIGELLLGDWRLSSASKEVATLSHPQGKSMTLKPAAASISASESRATPE